jgi:hypothetical protein
MERTSLQHGHTDSSRPQAFGDLPAPQRDTGGGGKRGIARRPIGLRSDRPIAPGDIPDVSIPMVPKTDRRRKPNQSAPRSPGRRPIGLKSALVIAGPATSGAEKPQGTKTVRSNRAGESGAKRSRAKAKSAPAIAKKGDLSEAMKTRGVKARQARKPARPTARTKTPVQGRTRQKAPGANDTSAPAPKHQGSPATAQVLGALGAWARERWRLLLIIGVSFIAGSVFHGWFMSEGPSAPSAVAPAEAPSATPAREPRVSEAGAAPKHEPVPHGEAVSGFYAPSVAAPGGRPSQGPAARAPSYAGGGGQQPPAPQYPPQQPAASQYPPQQPAASQYPPQQPAASQYRDYRWSEPGYQGMSQTPGANPRHPTGAPPAPAHRNRAKQQYNPWAPLPQRYPDGRPW